MVCYIDGTAIEFHNKSLHNVKSASYQDIFKSTKMLTFTMNHYKSCKGLGRAGLFPARAGSKSTA